MDTDKNLKKLGSVFKFNAKPEKITKKVVIIMVGAP